MRYWIILACTSSCLSCTTSTTAPQGADIQLTCGAVIEDASSNSFGGQIIAVDGQAGLRLVEPSSGDSKVAIGYKFYSWSPDGSLLAATRDGSIVVFDRSLAILLSVSQVSEVSWSPDSRRVGYFDEPDFVTVDVPTGDTTRHEVCPDQSEIPASHGCHDAAWSRAFDWILVSSRVTNFWHGQLSRPDGSEAEDIGLGARWSPDGRYLLQEAGGEYDWDFRIVDVLTREELVYQSAAPTSDLSDVYDIAWEGACHLTFRYRYEGIGGRITYNVCNQGTTIPLPDDIGETRAGWSDDGRQIAYVSKADSVGQSELVVFNYETGDRFTLCTMSGLRGATGGTVELGNLPWSRSGHHILATLVDPGDGVAKLALMSAGDSTLRYLGETEGFGSWSP